MRAAFENQVACGGKGNRCLKIAGHGQVSTIAGVLLIDHGGHALHGFHDLFFAANAVMQPIGDMLAGNTQSGAVFHQADIMNIGHFRAADALVDPTHHIAQNALRIIVEFLLHILWRPLRMAFDWHGQDFIKRGARAGLHFILHRFHINLVVVDGVQRCRRRRWRPSAIGTGLRLADFLFQHGGHQIRHGPHALADLRAALQPASQPDIDIPILISGQPIGGFHIGLADHRPHFHGGVNFVTRAIEKAGIDENNARFGGADTFFQIHRGATFFVHNPHFQGLVGQAERFFHCAEQRIGEGHLFRPVHFRLHDIDRPLGRVFLRRIGLHQIVLGQKTGHDGVHNAFGNFIAAIIEDGRIGH